MISPTYPSNKLYVNKEAIITHNLLIRCEAISVYSQTLNSLLRGRSFLLPAGTVAKISICELPDRGFLATVPAGRKDLPLNEELRV